MLRANYSDVKLLGVHSDHGVVHPQVPESPGHLLGEAGHPAQAEQTHRPPEAVGVRGLVRDFFVFVVFVRFCEKSRGEICVLNLYQRVFLRAQSLTKGVSFLV